VGPLQTKLIGACLAEKNEGLTALFRPYEGWNEARSAMEKLDPQGGGKGGKGYRNLCKRYRRRFSSNWERSSYAD